MCIYVSSSLAHMPNKSEEAEKKYANIAALLQGIQVEFILSIFVSKTSEEQVLPQSHTRTINNCCTQFPSLLAQSAPDRPGTTFYNQHSLVQWTVKFEYRTTPSPIFITSITFMQNGPAPLFKRTCRHVHTHTTLPYSFYKLPTYLCASYN
jgi:hypothetical protein